METQKKQDEKKNQVSRAKKTKKVVLNRYNPSFHPQELIKRMEAGELDVQIYADWNLSKSGFYKWIAAHEEFKEAREIGLAKYDAYLMREHFTKMAKGELEGKHSYRASEWLATNKLGYQPTGARGNQNNTQVNIENINVLQQKDPQQLLEFIKDNVEKLSNLGVIDAEFKVLPETKENNE